MQVQWINPFISATLTTFTKMLRQEARAGKPSLLNSETNIKDISGVIGISGSLRGAVVVGFPAETALLLVEKFIGEPVPTLNAEVSDAVGEFANIIAGYAKKDLPGEDLHISLPSVVRGPRHIIALPREVHSVVIPFESSVGSFVLEVGMKKVEG